MMMDKGQVKLLFWCLLNSGSFIVLLDYIKHIYNVMRYNTKTLS